MDVGVGVEGDGDSERDGRTEGGISSISSSRSRSSVAAVKGVGDGSSDIMPDVDGHSERALSNDDGEASAVMFIC